VECVHEDIRILVDNFFEDDNGVDVSCEIDCPIDIEDPIDVRDLTLKSLAF